MNDDNVIRGFSIPKFSLRTLLLIVTIVAMCVAFVIASDNRYHAICWLVPPLFILTRNHGKLDYASLAIRFVLAVVVWSILFFPSVLQDTEIRFNGYLTRCLAVAPPLASPTDISNGSTPSMFLFW